MRSIWRRLGASAVAAMLTLAVAGSALAAGSVPRGHGLANLAQQGIQNLDCTDPTIDGADVILPRGGGAATWVADGRLYVVTSVSVSGTVTTPEGSFPVAFSQSYGVKAGLEETVSCTFDTAFEEDGATFEGSGTVTLARVW